LYTAGHWESIPWILIKGISDWGDGTKSPDDPYHPLASASAASFFHEFCQIPGALAPVNIEDRKNQQQAPTFIFSGRFDKSPIAFSSQGSVHQTNETNQTFGEKSIAKNTGTVNFN